jgi:hypothetical protein
MTLAAGAALLASGQVSLALNIAVLALVILYLLHSVALLRLPRANPELYAQVQVRIPKAWQQAAGLASVASMAGIIGVQVAQDLAVLRATSLAERVASGSLTSFELAVAWSFAGWGIYALGRRRLRPGVA